MGEDKQKKAIALEYNPEEQAPTILAIGKGEVANRIIETAQEANVPVHRDDHLANTLSALNIGDMIPPELYQAVAEVLVFVDGVDKIMEKMERHKHSS